MAVLSVWRRAQHIAVVLMLLASYIPASTAQPGSATAPNSSLKDEPIRPIPAPTSLDRNKVLLGEKLFHDPRLSHDNTISCASCHLLERAGTDAKPVAVGIDGAQGMLNTPTVFNSRFNLAQFWNGRAQTLEEQATGPIHNPIEMGSNWSEIAGKLRRDRQLVSEIEAVYPDGLTLKNIADAIAAYERSLLTLDAPFDRYLRGDRNAISDQAKKGYELFKSYGCISCHQGVNVGGNMYQQLGVMGDYFADRGNISKADYGRFNVTGDAADRYFFKVPSLRLVTQTAPYFHDGSVQSLSQAIRLMARYQLGRSIPDKDIKPIISFLESLAGSYRRLEP